MIELLFSAIIITLANMYILVKLTNKKLEFRKIRTYLGIIFMILGLMLNFLLVNQLLKVLVIFIIMCITIKILFDSAYKDTVTLALMGQLLYIVSEVLVIIIVLIITNIQNKQELVELFSGTIYANIYISLLVIFVVNIPYTKNMYNTLVKLMQNQKISNIFNVVLMILFAASIIFNLIFYSTDLILVSFIGLGILILYFIFIIKGMMVRNNYLKMHVKYNSTLQTLKSHESILDKYKVSNHENKNQLLTIRTMAKNSNDDEVVKFIDKLIENKYKDDEVLIIETSKIPSGGLKALIYSKLLYMKNNNIDFVLKVDQKIRSVELIDLDDDLVLDICKIIGVFLDNAIEEVEKVKDGSVGIELYIIDGKFNISISNTFEGVIEIDKIYDNKYTTKGEGHGYGLSLVKDIITKNKSLENIRMINDNVFTQILRIN